MGQGIREATIADLASHGPEGAPILAEVLADISLDGVSRRLAQQSLRGMGDEAVARLRTLALSGRQKEREFAVGGLREIGSPAALEAIRDVLLDSVGARRRRRARAVVLAGAFLVLIIARFTVWRHSELAGLLQIAAQASFSVLTFDAALSMRRNAVSAMKEDCEPAMVTAIALCLGDRDREIIQSAATILRRILPRLTSCDAHLVSSDAMDAIIASLRGKNRDLSLAILKALEQIGDERALPVVEKLAAGKKRGKDEVVRKVAEECLPAVRLRAEQSRQANLLLRPASADIELLRPAGAGEVAAEVLVRSVGEV